MGAESTQRDAFVAGAVFAAGPAAAKAALDQLDELELTPAELIAEHTGRRELLAPPGGSVAGVTITVGTTTDSGGNVYYLAACPVCAVDDRLGDEPRFGGAGVTRDEAVARVREHLAVSHEGEPEHDDADGDADPALVARFDPRPPDELPT